MNLEKMITFPLKTVTHTALSSEMMDLKVNKSRLGSIVLLFSYSHSLIMRLLAGLRNRLSFIANPYVVIQNWITI